ncbi:hypothetical protein ABIB48_002710 [Arthrobacter sp. UYCu511]|uniref:hypothetical protein n=1 Tax=Arthrobacter sp. UYCu511 TaxID=3156337 RepID=UPI0033993556
MRTRTAIIALTLGAMAFSSLTACTGGTAEKSGGGGESGGATIGTTPTSLAGTEPSAFSTPPAATASSQVDIRSVDLANTTWLYSFLGRELPYEVTLVNGEATKNPGEFSSSFKLGQVVYGDVDGDGDEDAVAQLNGATPEGSRGFWYIWIADVSGAVQLKYPIAETTCYALVLPPEITDGAINLTEYLHIPGVDDEIPCSEPGTGLKKRTITVITDSTGSTDGSGPEMWPVQTAPVVAWGGMCPGPANPDATPGLVDLWASPSKTAQVAATTEQDGEIFEQIDSPSDSPLVEREGWSLVGFRIFGVKSDLGGKDLACAWAPK